MLSERGICFGPIDLCSGGRANLKVQETINEGEEGEFYIEQRTPEVDGRTKREQLTVNVLEHNEGEPAELLIVHTISYLNAQGVMVGLGRSINAGLDPSFLSPGKALGLPMGFTVGHRPANSL